MKCLTFNLSRDKPFRHVRLPEYVECVNHNFFYMLIFPKCWWDEIFLRADFNSAPSILKNLCHTSRKKKSLSDSIMNNNTSKSSSCSWKYKILFYFFISVCIFFHLFIFVFEKLSLLRHALKKKNRKTHTCTLSREDRTCVASSRMESNRRDMLRSLSFIPIEDKSTVNSA